MLKDYIEDLNFLFSNYTGPEVGENGAERTLYQHLLNMPL